MWMEYSYSCQFTRGWIVASKDYDPSVSVTFLSLLENGDPITCLYLCLYFSNIFDT